MRGLPSRMRYATLVAALALAFSNCSFLNDPTVCTMAGCETGLWLEFSSMPVGAYRIEVGVRSGAGQPAYIQECGAQCSAVAWFPGFVTDHGYVRITTPTATIERDIRPVYTRRQPNGDDCPPICNVAEVVVQL